MSTPPQQQTPAAGTGPRLKLNRNTLMVGGAGVVALLAFVMSRGGNGGGGSSQQFMPYDSTPYDQYNDLQDQLEDIQRQIDNGEVTPGTPKPPTPTPTSPKPTPVPAKPKPPVKPIPGTSNPAAKFVTIKKGDTLSAIAKRAGISMATLKKLNPVFWTNAKYHNGNTIFSGGKVRVK